MKTIRLLAISAIACVLGACAKDPIEGGGNFGSVNKLQVAFTIPEQVPGTYATAGALPAECKFDEAYVIFYDAAGKYVAYTSSNVQSGTSSGSFEVIRPATVEADKPYKMLVVANLKYYLDPTYVSTSDYINANKTLNYNAMQAEIKAMGNDRIFRNLPLYAQAEATFTETSALLSIVFQRAVARFDLVSLEKNLDIEWIKVCNYNNAGFLYHDRYSVTGSTIVSGAGEGDVEQNPKKVYITRRADMTDPLAAQANTAGGLYAFPNINVNTGVNDQKTTCLLFKGTYSFTDKDGKPQTKEGYYRVNICMLGKPQDIRRNSIYRITIKSVSDGGKDSEEEAIKNPTLNVNYEINDWAVDNSQEIITDDLGNYLAISPAVAYIGGSNGSSRAGNIKVKTGASWFLEKLVPADNWFSAVKTSDGSGFILTALTDNTTSDVRSSKLRVKLAGTALQYDMNIYQYTLTSSEDVTLIVDKRMGDFPLSVDGLGQTFSLPVTLGSNSARASLNYISGDKSMLKSINPALGIPGITNSSAATFVFRSNLSGETRSSVYKVTRTDGINPDISLKITFTQPPAAQVIVPTPSVLFENNSVDGVMNLTGAANSKKCKFQRVYVTMLDLESFPKWQATSTFNTYDVTLVAKPTVETETYPHMSSQKNVVSGASGECFDIAVARCGPGDKPLTGTITIEGCDAAGKVVPDGARYTMPLTVSSSLQSGFTQIGNLSGTSNVIWHDRNIGAPESNIGDETKITIPALPFSNFSGDYQSKNPDQDPNSYQNYRFRGTYHTFAEANTPANALCPEGWRMPTKAECEALAKEVQWAKAGGRPYIIANRGENAGKKGCYFPLSGHVNGTSYDYVFYGTTTMNTFFRLDPVSVAVMSIVQVSSSNIRCVKDI